MKDFEIAMKIKLWKLLFFARIDNGTARLCILQN
jgi:hypothetical protein